MKSVASFFAAIAAPFFVFTFLTIAVSACKKTAETVTPEPTGWNSTEFTPVNEKITSDHELTATLCSKQPQNFTAAVWYFPADADPMASVKSITDPGVDEDGEPEEAELPNDNFDVEVKFTEADGIVRSHYSNKAVMKFYLDADQLAVFQIADQTGAIKWVTLKTTGERSETCFAL